MTKFKIGQVWEDRKGSQWKIKDINLNKTWSITAMDIGTYYCLSFSPKGNWVSSESPSPHDLIKLVTESNSCSDVPDFMDDQVSVETPTCTCPGIFLNGHQEDCSYYQQPEQPVANVWGIPADRTQELIDEIRQAKEPSNSGYDSSEFLDY